MSKYIFCVNNEKYDPPCSGFWPLDERDLYPNTFPDTGVEVDEATKEKYTGAAPEGKRLGADENGNPTWLDTPPPSKEQLVAEAKAKKQTLIAEATVAIAPLQDAVDLGMATPEEDAKLKEWKIYRVLLNRIDTSSAPDIEWPLNPV